MKSYLLFIFQSLSLSLLAQAPVQIKGIVHDMENKKSISGVSVMLLKNKGTAVSNETGYFSLFIPATDIEDTLVVYCLGYEPVSIAVSKDISDFLFIQLARKPQLLHNVIIEGVSAQKLLEEAVLRIPSNYDTSVTWLQGNYEAFEKEDTLVTSKVEAKVQIKRPAFTKKGHKDSVEIHAAHVIQSRKGYFRNSTNVNTLLLRDAVKNSKSFLDKRFFGDFDYEMLGLQTLKGRTVFQIRFDQKEADQKYTSWKGEIFLDSASLAFVKISYGISSKGRGHRTLPWELALFARIRKGIAAQLVVHDVNLEYDTIGGKWTLKEIAWMDIKKWESTRLKIPRYQIRVQAISFYAIERNQTNRLIDKTKFFRPGIDLELIAPYNPKDWAKENRLE